MLLTKLQTVVLNHTPKMVPYFSHCNLMLVQFKTVFYAKPIPNFQKTFQPENVNISGDTHRARVRFLSLLFFTMSFSEVLGLVCRSLLFFLQIGRHLSALPDLSLVTCPPVTGHILPKSFCFAFVITNKHILSGLLKLRTPSPSLLPHNQKRTQTEPVP